MKRPKIILPAKIKRNLPTIFFVSIIPLGILIGYFFSNIKGFVAGGYRGITTPINRLLYVAKVDGVGIPKHEWEQMLKSNYGAAALQNLVDMYMVKNELRKAGIKASEEEINAEITIIESQLGGQSLEQILKEQGRTLADFRDSVSLQVGMKKLLGDKVVVSDQEVSDYVKSASSALQGTTDEEKFASAKKILTEQKLGEEINSWFLDLQSKVVVENYLK